MFQKKYLYVYACTNTNYGKQCCVQRQKIKIKYNTHEYTHEYIFIL